MKRKNNFISILNCTLIIILVILVSSPFFSYSVYAGCKPSCPCGPCCSGIGGCSKGCTCKSSNETGMVTDPSTSLGHVTKEFNNHRRWMVDVFFKDNIPGNEVGLLAAMKLMTDQLSVIGMHHVSIIGRFFDAKHQLETQRVFQILTSKAHKDYHTSQELCEFGTTVRSLASSDRISALSKLSVSDHAITRQLQSGDNVATKGTISYKASRLVQYIKDFCDPKDNAGNLDLLCQKGGNNPLLYNRDIDYTKTVSAPLTLDLDFTAKGHSTSTNDEKSLFALMSNLFSHETYPEILENRLVSDDDELLVQGYEAVIDARALTAKRSVAINSIASIAALKTNGDTQSKPFIFSAIQNLGGQSLQSKDIENILGKNPSYDAQMEVLTKKIFQDSEFYIDTYDKPSNVARQEVAIQAIELMQKRDLYRSFLRSEIIASVMLETALLEEQDRIKNDVKNAIEGGKSHDE